MEYAQALETHREELKYATFGLKLGTSDAFGSVNCLCCDSIHRKMESDGTPPELRKAFYIGFTDAYRTDGEGSPHLQNVIDAREAGEFDREYSDFCDTYCAEIYG